MPKLSSYSDRTLTRVLGHDKNNLVGKAQIRELLTGTRSIYVGAVVGAPAISIASPAVVTLASHGLSNGDAVNFSVPENTTACTISEANPGVVTMANTFAAGQPVKFASTGHLPNNVTVGTTYYVIAAGLSGASFQFSATVGGAAIDTSAISASFTNGSATIATGAAHGAVVGQIVRLAGTSVVNFSNATDYYVISIPTGSSMTIGTAADGTAIVAGVVTSNGTLVQAGTHYNLTGGLLPTGVTEGTTYYAGNVAANTFNVYDTFANAIAGGSTGRVNTSGSVTGSPVYSVYTGSDLNDGSAPTRASALLTLDAVYPIADRLDYAGFAVTAQLCTGVFTSGGWFGPSAVPSGGFIINGAGRGLTRYVGSNGSLLYFGNPGSYQVTNLKFVSSGINYSPQLYIGVSFASVGLGGVEFGDCDIFAPQIFSNGQFYPIAGNPCFVSPSVLGGTLFRTVETGGSGSNNTLAGGALTYVNTPSYSQMNIYVADLSILYAYSLTVSGGAAGPRFFATDNAILQTFGSGVHLFPGSVAGTTGNGGIAA